MDLDTLRGILLAAAGIVTGGGFLKLLDFWVKHRAEVRKISTSSDVDTSTVAINQAAIYKDIVTQLQADGVVHRQQVGDLQAKVGRLEDRHIQAEQDFTRQLRDSHSENSRLARRIATLETDLDIAHRQVAELRRRLGDP